MARTPVPDNPPRSGLPRSRHWVEAAAIVVLLALATLIAVSPPILIYDERYYMASSYYLVAHYDLLGPLRPPLDLAAGPLYAHLHVLLSPLTRLELPAVRYFNWSAPVLTLVCCWRTLDLFGYRQAPARAAMLLAVPMLGPTAGMALTEVPALAAASLALLAARQCSPRRRLARGRGGRLPG